MAGGKPDKAAKQEAKRARREASRARYKQIWQAFQMQRREDKALVPIMVGVLLLSVVVVFSIGLIFDLHWILLPLGIPVLMLARKLFAYAMTMMVPRKVRHPVDELGKSARRGAKKTRGSVLDFDTKPLTKAAWKTRKKGRSVLKEQRKRFA